MMHHANARTVIVLDEAEREAARAALADVVRMIDEVARKVEDPASEDAWTLDAHHRALSALLRAVSA